MLCCAAGVQAVIIVAEDASQFGQIIELSNKCVTLRTYFALVICDYMNNIYYCLVRIHRVFA